MTTYSPFILDRLLEPGSGPAPPSTMHNSKLSRAEGSLPAPSGHAYRNQSMLPELYKTPETTPAPDASSSFPPSSPYIVNHKRRGQSLQSNQSSQHSSGGESLQAMPQLPPLVRKRSEKSEKIDGNVSVVKESDIDSRDSVGKNVNEFDEKTHVHENEAIAEEIKFDLLDVGITGAVMDQESLRSVDVESGRETDNDDFYDPDDNLSTASNNDGNDIDNDMSICGSSRSAHKIEAELRESILREVSKLKQAEEQIESLKSQWQRLSHHLARVGLTLPPLQSAVNEEGYTSHNDPGADLCQQITVSRVVAAAIARAFTRTEVMADMDPLIASKNAEIARLSDRIQIYETMNREMSHRNIEITTQERSKRKRRQRWLWASVTLAVTVGAAAIAWTCLPSSTSEKIPDASQE